MVVKAAAVGASDQPDGRVAAVHLRAKEQHGGGRRGEAEGQEAAVLVGRSTGGARSERDSADDTHAAATFTHEREARTVGYEAPLPG
jgi:hypothetical protein